VDLRFIKKDWNDECEKDGGRWSPYRTFWRESHVRGFVSGLSAAALAGGVEIVAVGHGSFFRKLVGEAQNGELAHLSPAHSAITVN
jgi:hypothetical protein